MPKGQSKLKGYGALDYFSGEVDPRNILEAKKDKKIYSVSKKDFTSNEAIALKLLNKKQSRRKEIPGLFFSMRKRRIEGAVEKTKKFQEELAKQLESNPTLKL